MLDRAVFIFERMVRKYSNDLSVWLKYVDFCQAYGFETRLASLYPRYECQHPLS